MVKRKITETIESYDKDGNLIEKVTTITEEEETSDQFYKLGLDLGKLTCNPIDEECGCPLPKGAEVTD